MIKFHIYAIKSDHSVQLKIISEEELNRLNEINFFRGYFAENCIGHIGTVEAETGYQAVEKTFSRCLAELT